MTLTTQQLQKLKQGASGSTDDEEKGFYVQDGKAGVRFSVPTFMGGSGDLDFYIDYSKKRNVGDFKASLQGVSLGTADEAEAWINKALGDNRPKDEILSEIRQGLKEYQQENPKAALSSEILGSLITGKLGIGKTAVNTFLRAIGLGGVYSAAKTEPDKDATIGESIEQRAKEGVKGAAITAPFAVVGSALQSSPVSQKLLKEGVKLSPAQIVGSGASSIEKIQAITPFLGRGARRAREESVISFSRASANQILGKIKQATGLNIKPIKSNQTAQQGTIKLNKAINVAYDKTIRPLKIDKAETNIENNFLNIIENNLSDPTDIRAINKFIKKEILNKFKLQKNKTSTILTGRDLKNTHSKIRTAITRAKNNPLTSTEKLDALIEIEKELVNAMKISSNPKDFAKYVELDKVYPDYLAYRNAAIKGQKETIEKAGDTVSGAVTPDKLIDEGISLAKKRGKDTLASEGKFPMSTISQTAQPILKSTKMQEDLAPFYLLGGQAALLGGGFYQAPTATGLTAASLAALYGTAPGRRLLSEILRRDIAPRLSPVTGAELNERLR
tara:strand:+ start:2006 stop:3682 length:1677 start_codon:yes stop_codon:yes gene_type:complete